MRIVPYVIDGVVQEEHRIECEGALAQMVHEAVGDRHGDNYKIENLNLDQMKLFTVTFEQDEPVQVSGCQVMSENVVRVFSRYFAFRDWRTQGHLLEKVDNFKELRYSMNILKDVPLLIWTRDKAPSFFERLKVGRPDIFHDWEVHSDSISILSPNNHQYIFYKGDPKYLDEIDYDKIQ